MINLSDRTWRGLREAIGLPSTIGAVTLLLLFIGRMYGGLA
ncbi:MAG: hypothetical protein PVJ76_11345 [Gemmatimonadota bacterium]|jgi:hypothetical protein